MISTQIIEHFDAVAESRKWKEKVAADVEGLHSFEERKQYFQEAAQKVRRETLLQSQQNEDEQDAAQK
jgi:heme exporter protein D